MNKALGNDFWIQNLSSEGGISVIHINEFFSLLNKLQGVHLVEDVMDSIT